MKGPGATDPGLTLVQGTRGDADGEEQFKPLEWGIIRRMFGYARPARRKVRALAALTIAYTRPGRDLVATGSDRQAARIAGVRTGVVVIGVSARGPAARAELKAGDVILALNGEKITSQSAFYRKLWALGPAGVDVPLTVHHDGVTFDVVLTSIDRTRLLKGPRLH